jgi:aspartyl/asparaginyl beta-hydroxylase (cupin superfamily)
MSKPLVASVSHELGKREAKQRIESGLGEIRAHLSTFATSVEEKWTEDRLDFRLIAFGQAISGNINVFEDVIRIEVVVPAMLSLLRGQISSRIRKHGMRLLETK